MLAKRCSSSSCLYARLPRSVEPDIEAAIMAFMGAPRAVLMYTDAYKEIIRLPSCDNQECLARRCARRCRNPPIFVHNVKRRKDNGEERPAWVRPSKKSLKCLEDV